MHVLLVEPAYYSRYPPLGLLKIATYWRDKGATVELVRGCVVPSQEPNLIYVTSLFTWAWKPVWEAVRHYKGKFPGVHVQLGGLYASIMKEHAELSGADNVHTGVLREVEDCIPAYDLVPEWDATIIQASRGCNRRCPYCAVWRIEGKIKSTKDRISHLVYPGHKRIILWDNNILQSPNWRGIFDELVTLSQNKGLKIDFNQGLDARLVTDEVAEKISKMKTSCVRFSYDNKSVRQKITTAVDRLNKLGLRRRHVGVYILFNYLDSPDDFFERIRDVLESGAVAMPLRYQPLDSLKYNSHVGPFWDKEKLEQFSQFRRVCGFGGVFPPYKWLVERFHSSQGFDGAFELPRKNSQLQVRAHKDYYESWRNIQDWKTASSHFIAKEW
jgi:hypothetical protein